MMAESYLEITPDSETFTGLLSAFSTSLANQIARCHTVSMTQQITVRVPDEIARWLDRAESKTDVVTAALRKAYREELHQQVLSEYKRVPAETADEWGDPTEFTQANQAIVWGEDAG